MRRFVLQRLQLLVARVAIAQERVVAQRRKQGAHQVSTETGKTKVSVG